MIRQAGAIRVDSLDELVDTTAALVRLGEVHGDNGGLMCMTGGESVVITDTFGKQGLNVPRLTQKSYDEFATFFNVIGGSYQNPLDVSYNFGSPDVVRRLLRIMNDDENTDFVGLEMFVSTMRQTSGEKTEAFHGAIAEHAAAPSSKPFFTLVTATSAERGGRRSAPGAHPQGDPGLPVVPARRRGLQEGPRLLAGQARPPDPFRASSP